MRLSRFALLLPLALGVVACGDDDEGPVTPNLPPLAYVRYINAVPDTLNTTVRFVDQVEFSPMTFANVAFRAQGQGNYQPTQAGARKFKVFTADFVDFSTAGNTAVLVDTTITFEAGKYYTLLHSGYARTGSTPRQGIQVIVDDLPTPGASVAVRAINASPVNNTLDVFFTPLPTTAITGAPAIPAVPFRSASTYRTVAAAQFASQIAAAGSTTSLAGAAAPAGVAGTTAVNPIAGATIPGSVLTAIAFPASVAGSRAASFTTPGVAYFLDKAPPATAP